ncbi:MAG: DNA protecting protein DprA [Legionellales bacterium RIFCSPHIGHO2_12_FULL_37_14]|nr:MAG: DNA protecting protein DprA [Legionellales bacterium RIFCSPHIGHO2_12_FULL_37_14]
METKNQRYFIALNAMPLIGPRSILKLLARWQDLEECFKASKKELLEAGLKDNQIQQIKHFDWNLIAADLAFAKQDPAHTILTIDSPLYPLLLKEIHSPPIVLYAKGDLSCFKQPTLAIVGSRYPSCNGSQTAFLWSKELSAFNLTIVSGMAKGIDTAAHSGALNGSGKTIAVLGCGVDVVYPYSNLMLAKKIPDNGLILSEFPLKTKPKAGHFPQRNRIISGLAVATLIIEATLKSGSLITARFALEQNRDVLALPGSINLPQSQGCNHLLKQGASLVTCYQDVLMELGFIVTPKEALIKAHRLSNDSLLNCIGMVPTHIDEIMANQNLSLKEVVCQLAELELYGKVRAVPGGYIRRFHER